MGHFEHDQELSAVWQNSIADTDPDASTSFTPVGSICYVKSEGTSKSLDDSWIIVAKRRALGKVANLVKSFSHDQSELMKGFIEGEITQLKLDEEEKSIKLTFKLQLKCP